VKPGGPKVSGKREDSVILGAPSRHAYAGAAVFPLLEMVGIKKRFGGTEALRGVGLELREGEILALLGENGAGKSTLIKILAGVYTADEGIIRFRGEPIGDDALGRLPIRFIHQDLGLIEWMTVAENVALALGYPRRFGFIDWKAVLRQAEATLGWLDIAIFPDMRVRELSRTEKSLVAISRALAAAPAVLVLDEPTASLPADEVSRLFAALRQLKAHGVAMIYVSHRIDEVFEIADRMVVLRDGAVVAERPVGEVTPREAVRLIVGREPEQVLSSGQGKQQRVRLRLQDVRVNDVGPVNAAFRAGEIVGLTGLRGAGQEAIGRALFGLAPITAGAISFDDRPLSPASPDAAMAAGIGLVWGDRLEGSIVPTLSVRENFFLNPKAARTDARSVLISPRAEAQAARRLGMEVGLVPNDPNAPIESLSGGNQQKVVVGRWLHLGCHVYIFEDPTAGVDIGAKSEIYRLFVRAAEEGAVLIIVSTDFEEVARICHRALVFDRGVVVTELTGQALSVNALLAAASAEAVTAAN